jgi:hypothetical protein
MGKKENPQYFASLCRQGSTIWKRQKTIKITLTKILIEDKIQKLFIFLSPFEDIRIKMYKTILPVVLDDTG